MPRRLATGFLALAILLLSAFAALPDVTATLVSDEGTRIVIDFRFSGYALHPVRIGEAPFSEVVLGGASPSLEKGAPGLPHVVRDVIVPDRTALGVRVLEQQSREVAAAIAPSRGVLSRSGDPAHVPYVFGPAYRADRFYPEALASLGEPYVFRDYRGVTVRVSPFQFNPKTGVLRVVEHVVVEVAVTGASRTNLLPPRAPRAAVRSFEAIYRGHFLNYGQGRFAYPGVDEDGELLIIAHDAWLSNVEPLAAHKRDIGIPTTVVGVSTIGNTASAIKNYISDFYNAHNLAFVLLVGDSAQVATPLRNGDNASDPTYAQLAGADAYPEILVGRFSAQNPAQVDTQVLRTVEYEDQSNTSKDWFKRGIGIASDQGEGQGDEGQSDRTHQNEIRDWLLGDGYTSVDKIYDPGATAQQVSNAVNAGRGIINYTGHGSATSWGTTGFNTNDVAALVNKDQLPFIVSVACNNGEFNHFDPCFAEAWLRASKDGRPTGAVGIYASSISQSWASPMEGQDEFNLKLTDTSRPYHTFGGLCFAGGSSMISKYGSDGVDMFDTWHVFGDPSLRVVGTVQPQTGLRVGPQGGLTSSGAPGALPAPSSIVYTLDNLDAAPLEFEVTASRPWVAVSASRGTLPPNGSTTVTVSLTGDAANLDVGAYTDSVQFTNLTSHQGDTTRAVALQVALNVASQRFPLDADPGWSRQGEWQYGKPLGLGGAAGFNPDPSTAATGTNVLGTNLAGAIAGRAGGPFYLTAGPFDLGGALHTSLRFSRWLNALGPTYMSNTIEISTNGSSWTPLWTQDKDVIDGAWSMQTIDTSSIADGQPAVWIRWGYALKRSLPSGPSGWNIDDVEIRSGLASARTTLSVTRDALSWTAIPGVSGYDVVRGDGALLLATSGDFTASTGACIAGATAATTAATTEQPSPGGLWWFLVRGRTMSGPLTYQDLAGSQSGLRDAEIDAASAACH